MVAASFKVLSNPRREVILLKKNDMKIPPKISKEKAKPTWAGSTPCLFRTAGKVTKFMPIAMAKSRILKNNRLRFFENFNSESMKNRVFLKKMS